MHRKFLISTILSTLLLSAFSCNTADDTTYDPQLSSSVLVSGFSLTDDKKVLDSLSNVFFSIDLVNARIFNADSLPYGTNVSRLIPKIVTPSSASAVTLKYYEPSLDKDSIVNYLTNSTDSINFAGGPVTLTVVSENGSVKRDYEIKVNVHTVKADSMVWYKIQTAPLPGDFSRPTAQATACLNNTFYCLTTDGSKYCLATTSSPQSPGWATREATFDFEPDIESLRATSDSFYILDKDGNMFASADFENWTSTGQSLHYLYGAYGDQILASKKTESGYSVIAYPSGNIFAIPAEFPVDGASLPTFFSLSMSYGLQAVIVGGRLADGSLTDATWGFDGSSWAEISVKPLPYKLRDVTLVPYRLVDMLSSTWSPSSYPVLLAMGGRNDQEAINSSVYYSRDWGMTWKKGPSLIQLPKEIPAFYGASAFNHVSVMHTGSRSSYWNEIQLPSLMPGTHYINPYNPTSRATAPIDEWNCEEVYLFGGRDTDGNLLNTLWRGVITQFTFVPVQ